MDLLIFDMDGVLIDVSKSYCKRYQSADRNTFTFSLGPETAGQKSQQWCGLL